jgi:hypothetical protein
MIIFILLITAIIDSYWLPPIDTPRRFHYTPPGLITPFYCITFAGRHYFHEYAIAD